MVYWYCKQVSLALYSRANWTNKLKTSGVSSLPRDPIKRTWKMPSPKCLGIQHLQRKEELTPLTLQSHLSLQRPQIAKTIDIFAAGLPKYRWIHPWFLTDPPDKLACLTIYTISEYVPVHASTCYVTTIGVVENLYIYILTYPAYLVHLF